MNLWSLAKVFESIRYAVLNHGFGYFDQLKDKDHSIFLVSTTYRVTKKGNEIYSYKHWGFHCPMLVSLNVTSASNSTFTFTIDVQTDKTRERLFSAELTFVYVDYNTRKPTKFPEWYNEHRRQANISSRPIQRLSTPPIPTNAFSFEVKTAFSDLDFNGHLNNSVYVKWCTDAGTEAAKKGHYSKFNDNIGKYEIEKVELKYVKEGMLGDRILVNTWEEPASPLTIHFVMTKKENVVFVSRFVYKSGENTLSKL